MVKTSYDIRRQWNADHYTQVKISIEKDAAAKFKSACKRADISMAAVLKGKIDEFVGNKRRPIQASDYSTRKKRRNAVSKISAALEKIKEAEEDYLAAMPENLKSSVNHTDAEQCVEKLEEALWQLEEAYP